MAMTEPFTTPELLLAALIVALVLLEAVFAPRGARTANMGYASLFGGLVILAVALSTWPEARAGDGGSGGTAVFYSYFTVVLLSFACLTILMSLARKREDGDASGVAGMAFYPLLLSSVLGMMVMVRAQDLLLLFVSLELAALSLQALLICARPSRIAARASLRLALTGGIASGFFLLGLALVYGVAGTTSLPEIVAAHRASGVGSRLMLAGMGLLAIAVGVRIGVVPVHAWLPDVFQGASVPVAALLASAGVAAGVAVAMRLCAFGFDLVEEHAIALIWIAAVVTMTGGNLLAMNQRRLKGLLGHASVIHVGYALAGLSAMGSRGGGSVAFYLLFHGAAICGCCAVLLALTRHQGKGLEMDDCLGLARRHPLLGGALIVLSLSLIGLPPTMGFCARFWVLDSVLSAGHQGLAVCVLINSLLTAYVYGRLLVRVLAPAAAARDEAAPIQVDPPLAAALVLTLLLTLGGGVWPEALVTAARQAGLIGW